MHFTRVFLYSTTVPSVRETIRIGHVSTRVYWLAFIIEDNKRVFITFGFGSFLGAYSFKELENAFENGNSI